MISQLVLLLFPLLMFIAAWRDVVSMTIPNWVSLALLGLFLVAAPLIGLSWTEFGLHMAVGLGALLLTILMFALRWIGGGDAKLFAAAALWMGWPDILPYALIAALIGGLFSVLLIFARKTALPPVLYTQKWSANLLKKDGDMPYGVALCAAALFYFPSSALFLRVIS
ncbi:Type IV prepilin peptidase TadV/CpaA [hydrothermal vent metagenome]|uniref:Type IV prepilin peptidase TadV/CpaA n=1 Tax=hydrothermal vent metagenome TaxID=652676 RepID=A0A3B0RX69_9ZZZZ